MDNRDVEYDMDSVKIFGQLILRPEMVSRFDWVEFWKRSLKGMGQMPKRGISL